MMKRTRKRVLSLIMTLALLLGLIPAMSISAAAVAATSVTLGGITLTNGETAVYAVAGTSAGSETTDGATNLVHNVTFDNGTLTLSGVDLTSGITFNGDAVIALQGANRVAGTISSNGSLTIKDSGTLEVTPASGNGISAASLSVNSGSVNVTDSADTAVNVTGAMTVSGGYFVAENNTAAGSGVSAASLAISGGYVKATGVTAGVTGAVTVSEGYLEASGAAGITGAVTNSDGVIKATGTAGNGIAGTANCTGGVTIANGSTAAISGDITGDSSEKLYDNVGGTLNTTAVSALNTTATTSALTGVVIAKSASTTQSTATSLDGVYLNLATEEVGVYGALTSKSALTVDGGSYITVSSNIWNAIKLGADLTVKKTLVVDAPKGAGKIGIYAFSHNVTVDTGGSLISSAGDGIYSCANITNAGNIVVPFSDAGVTLSSDFKQTAGNTVIVRVSTEAATTNGISSDTYTYYYVLGGTLTVDNGASTGYALRAKGNGTKVPEGASMTAISAGKAAYCSPVVPDGMTAYGSAEKYTILSPAYIGTTYVHKTTINGPECKVVYYYGLKPVPAVAVAAQSGTLTAGKVSSATFAVTTKDFTVTPVASGYSPTWYTSSEGTTTESSSARSGITLTATNASTLTATTTTAAKSGTHYFKLTAASGTQSAVSEIVKLTVDPAYVAAVTFKDGTTTKYEDFATAWNAAVGDSTTGTTGTAATTFQLLADWTATADSGYGTSFGSGAGFGYGLGSKTGYIHIPSGKNMILDLNGHKIDRALTQPTGSTPDDATCAISNSGTLTLRDTSDSNTAGTSVKGIITGTYEKTPTAANFGLPGCIWNQGTLTMQGGQITGNKSETNGAGVLNTGTFTMTGGKITANIANTNADSVGVGGGVYNSGTFTMTGGEISGNYAVGTAMGGGVYNSGTMTVGDTAVIMENYAGATYNTTSNSITANGTANNVYLETGKTLTVGPAFTGTAPQIGVTTQTAPTSNSPVAVTGTNGTTDYSTYFRSDSSAFAIYNDSTASDAQVVKLKFSAPATFDSRNGTAVTKDNYNSALTTWTSGSNTYTFDGWYTGIDGMGKKLTAAPAVGTTYYAKWTNGGKTVRTEKLNITDEDTSWQSGCTSSGTLWTNSDQGWTYDTNSKILTLNGVTFDSAERSVVTLLDGTMVTLTGGTTNTVRCNGSTDVSSIALYAVSDGTETGGGLTINGSGTLNAYSGIDTGNTPENDSVAILGESGVIIEGTPVINAYGNTSNTNSVGISSSGGDVTIKGGSVNAVASGSSYKDGGSIAINAFGTLTISGGTVTATGGAATGQANSVGLYGVDGVAISGGTVTAKGGAAESQHSFGIAGGGAVSFTGGTTNASGESAAVVSYDNVTFTNVVVTNPTGTETGTMDDFTSILSAKAPATSVTIGVKPDDTVVPILITTPTTSTATSTVVVDGKTTDAGKVTTTTNSDGTKNNTVAVNPTTLEKQVAAADKGSSVVVTVPASTGSASAQLVVKDVETLNAKEMSLEIKTAGVTYTVAPNAIDTAKVAAALGAADTAKVPLTVTVTPVKQSDVKVAEGTQIANPVKFEVTATYNGKTTEISTFDSYVSRDIAIPDGVDPSKITTGIRIEDGEHVPTFVYQQGGKYFAKINSLTNSTYTVVYNEKSFADTTGKWYEKAVTEMASREVINGKTDTTFAGDASITRAEFAAILARALGLPEGGTNSFSDVASDAWCYGAVGAAVKYGIINGYTDGSFKPGKNITREEAMAMMQRAAKVTGYAGTTGALTGFSDAAKVGSWAKSAVTFNVGSGLIQGNAGKLNPKSNITRAETAVVVLRLLQKSTLVDVRTNA